GGRGPRGGPRAVRPVSHAGRMSAGTVHPPSSPVPIAAIFLAVSGCHGSARMEFVSSQLNAIDPPPPVVYRYEPQQCYAWTESDGSFNIAMRFDNFSPLNQLGRASLL